jgi:hypothetical protein
MNRQQRRKMEHTTAKTENGKANKFIDLSELRAKTNGEVFTPPKLVEEMLDKFPKDVFSKKELTWLDPCCGATAVFPIMIMFRLADGLRDVIPDPKERIKHIAENMLYMVENDPDACDFGVAGVEHYVNLLELHLSRYDSPIAVDYLRNGYIENYEGIIETFYESISKKSA